MKTPINDGGAAFPVMYVSEGMSLRDYFAGQALALAYREAVKFSETCEDGKHQSSDGMRYNIIPREQMASRSAYKAADAMLAERERKEGVK
jgi:hypothetical protein